jgi:hypothetical protein
MMKINLSPFAPLPGQQQLVVSKSAEIISIDGKDFDLSAVAESENVPAAQFDSPYIIGDVSRSSGDLELTLYIPVLSTASHAARFPDPIIDPPDGPIQFPQ